MNKFTSVLAAIALAATSSASTAVEETTDKRNTHRTHAPKPHAPHKTKAPAGETKSHAAKDGSTKPEILEKDQK